MKTGDTVPVTVAGQVVAQAAVVELDKNTATLIVPATRVVMAVRTELAVEEPKEEGPSTLITGVDRVDGDGNVVETATQGGEVTNVSDSATFNAEPETPVEAKDNSGTPTPQPQVDQTSVGEPKTDD